nr:MAG TPA: hypothetical protein [Caudoviricetes sp.]
MATFFFMQVLLYFTNFSIFFLCHIEINAFLCSA